MSKPKIKVKCEHTHTNLDKFYIKYIVYCIRRKHRNHFLVTRLRPWQRTGISGGSIRCVRGPDTGLWGLSREGGRIFHPTETQSELDRFSPSFTERTQVHSQNNFRGVDKNWKISKYCQWRQGIRQDKRGKQLLCKL